MPARFSSSENICFFGFQHQVESHISFPIIFFEDTPITGESRWTAVIFATDLVNIFNGLYLNFSLSQCK